MTSVEEQFAEILQAKSLTNQGDKSFLTKGERIRTKHVLHGLQICALEIQKLRVAIECLSAAEAKPKPKPKPASATTPSSK